MTEEHFAEGFRSRAEALTCYQTFDRIVSVSEGVKEAFSGVSGITNNCDVRYNVLDTKRIRTMADEAAEELSEEDEIRLVAMGSLKEGKGFERLLSVAKKLHEEGERFTLYLLGRGPLQKQLENFATEGGISEQIRFLGYQTNPYRVLSKCDLFVCPSFAEGFSTAAAEALIVGTPVCTTDVSGMKELLGENNEFGVVMENSEQGLYQGLKGLLHDSKKLAYYKQQAKSRGEAFQDAQTVKTVEELMEGLWHD